MCVLVSCWSPEGKNTTMVAGRDLVRCDHRSRRSIYHTFSSHCGGIVDRNNNKETSHQLQRAFVHEGSAIRYMIPKCPNGICLCVCV